MSTNPKPPDITKDVPIHRLCPFNRPNQRRKRKRQRRNKWFQSHGREKRSSWQTTWSSVAVCVVPSRCRCHVCIVYVCHVSRIMSCTYHVHSTYTTVCGCFLVFKITAQRTTSLSGRSHTCHVQVLVYVCIFYVLVPLYQEPFLK